MRGVAIFGGDGEFFGPHFTCVGCHPHAKTGSKYRRSSKRGHGTRTLPPNMATPLGILRRCTCVLQGGKPPCRKQRGDGSHFAESAL